MHTERQIQIIEAGLELISTKGIQALTIKNLSKKIGVTEPAIYRHFDNKIQILTTILDWLKYSSSKLFEEEVNTPGTAVEKITHLFTNHFKALVETPSLTSVIFSEEIFRNESTLIEKMSEVIEHNNRILTSIVREGKRNNEIRDDIDAESLVIMIMGTLRLYIKKWQFSGMKFNLEKEGAKIINMLKVLIAKP
ncbi:MAG: TetR/AcrR family transcriptional regulator [Bacteroidales bacterium]|nr:TetR/AcrR family transcriptional regulator [Bacteroidales bacterium]MDT8431769.1 TetR/AcrR family transcriptional regulator [Bacteroidales bacterium]